MAQVKERHRRAIGGQGRHARGARHAMEVVGRAGLTEREQTALQTQADKAFASGKISLRFMGLRFLELYFLGWTPISGIRCSQAAFEEIWDWWNGLHPQQRLSIMHISRARN